MLLTIRVCSNIIIYLLKCVVLLSWRLFILLVSFVPGGASRFFVTFSFEVYDGLLVTSLPAELINSTELKLKTSYQWQPLQTYVTISKHFKVKATGVRFRGTINDCNSIMQQLFYQVRFFCFEVEEDTEPQDTPQ